MNCCSQCFESSYVQDIIARNKTKGDCNYCKSTDVPVYDPSQLIIFFKGIIDLYEVNAEEGTPIQNQIVLDFPEKVFSSRVVGEAKVQELLDEILKDEIADYKILLAQPVRLRYLSSDVEDILIKPLTLSWDTFSDEIKKVNRFHFVNAPDLDKLKALFKNFEKDISRGRKFYRARISTDPKGFPSNKMANPPWQQATAGRANPEGISYLYLANDIDTTMYEARASLLDYVSVGTFRLEENINVINLNRTTYDVFRLAELETLEEVLMHNSFIDKLEKELSKPRRKQDSELDYLPTQYLSELIKSMGYDGIEFQSSLNPAGYNIASFYPDKFSCINVDVYDVKKISLTYDKI